MAIPTAAPACVVLAHEDPEQVRRPVAAVGLLDHPRSEVVAP
ncbi:hypothetical protein [Curtobacterium caseinilyticum]|uniref:Uncharacterized protein n=1 Tax=Curtobacterium caseinilyticum TaxID=3055137 RepID=A0ABT7TM11_9MICO|nr:hypothetical protein [Curtobacterium caseinilyticum]MDM7890551.1 hypothetical protein [Curtobacterium caseinilyticum]